jgi:hypothetical protein
MVPFQVLRKLRSRISQNIKAAVSNVEDRRQLANIKSILNDAIDSGFKANAKFDIETAKKAKEVNKKALTELIKANKLKDSNWYRGTNISELERIIKDNRLLVGQSAEGHAGISAYKVNKKSPVTMQGSYDDMPVAIVGTKKNIEGVGQGVNEVLVDPKTDPKDLLYLIDGKLYDYKGMSSFVKKFKALKQQDKSIAEAYKKATTFYRDYSDKFKEGTVAEILKYPATVPMTKIGKLLTTKEGVRDFLKVVKDAPDLQKNLTNYLDQDFYKTVYDKITDTVKPNKAYSWLNKNTDILKALDVKDKYLDIVKQLQKGQVAKTELEAFIKPSTLTGKLLQSSPENVIKTAFSASRNYKATAQELQKLASGDPKALQGLQQGLADHIMSESKITSEGFKQGFRIDFPRLDAQYRKYLPAIQVLYKNAPKKLRALANIHKAYKVLHRNQSSLVAKSPRALNIFSTLSAIGGTGSLKYPVAFAIKKLLQKHSDAKIKQLLLRATFDPDYAMGLEYLFNSKTSKQATKALSELNKLVSRLTAYAVSKDKGENDAS